MDRLAKHLEQSSHSIGRGKREDRSGHSCLMASVDASFPTLFFICRLSPSQGQELTKSGPLTLSCFSHFVNYGGSYLGWLSEI